MSVAPGNVVFFEKRSGNFNLLFLFLEPISIDVYRFEQPKTVSKTCDTSSKPSAEDSEPTPEEVVAERYLLSCDAANWKKHDLYMILGLAHLRLKANDEDLKLAYRRRVLQHHPDKKTDQSEDNIFKCIQKSYEILCNPTKRRQFDSIDPSFDENIPSDQKPADDDEFFYLYKKVFERNGRYSKVQPVPSLGTLEDSRETVEAFYRFWGNFESWRSFEWLDEEESSSNDNREDKRWIEKKNKAARLKRKNEDNARIIKLVDQAMKYDPRIRAFKEADKQARKSKKQAKSISKSVSPAPQAQSKEDLMKLIQVKNAQEKAQKEKLKAEIKNMKAEIRDFLYAKNYFLIGKPSSRQIDIQCEKLESKMSNMNLIEDLKALKEKLSTEGASALNVAPSTPTSPIKPTEASDSAVTDETASALSSEWTPAEMQFLIEAVKLYPGGSQNRWEKIAAFVSSKTKLPERPQSEIISRSAALKQAPKVANREDKELLHATQVDITKKKMDSRIGNNTPSTPMTTMTDEHLKMASTPSNTSVSTAWSTAEQQLLEEALRQFPASDSERWSKIAQHVQTKTKKECKQRFIELAELVKSKQSQKQ